MASASAPALSALSALGSARRSNRLLLLREDVVDGAAGALTDRLCRASGVSVSPRLGPVGVGLLKNRGDALRLSRGEGEVFRHSFDTVGESFRLASASESLELRALRWRQHFADQSSALAS